MAGGNGIAVTITAQDRASKAIDAINRKITQANAPVVRLQKSFGQLAQSTGIRDTAREMKGLADSSARIFANMGRAGPALAGIGSAAGLGLAMRQAAQYGTGIALTARRAGVSTSALQRFGAMAEISGGSAEGAAESLAGLNKNLQLYSHQSAETDPRFAAAMRNLGISALDAHGNARKASDVMGDILRKLAAMHNQQQKLYYGNALLGGSFSSVLYPAVSQGTKKLQDYADTASRMVIVNRQQDEALQQSQVQMRRFGSDIEGVVYGALGDFAPAVSKNLGALSDWIEHNQRTSESIAKITAAVIALGAARPAAWALRLLGLGAAVPVAAPLAAATGAGIAAKVLADQAGYAPTGAPDILSGEELPTYTPIGPRSPIGPAPATAIRPPTDAARKANMEQTRAFWKSKGFTDSQVAGILAGGPAAESGFNPSASGDDGTSYGMYQWHNDRMRALVRKYGMRPTVQQQNEFAWEELNDPQNRNLLRSLRAAQTPGEEARRWTLGFERPAGGDATANLRASNAELFMPQKQEAATTIKGGATLDIRINGAPPGSQAIANTTGDLWQGAPRVTMPMPYGGGPAS